MTHSTDHEAANRPLRVVAITPTSFLSGAEGVLIRQALAGGSVDDRWTVLAPEGAVTERLASEGISHVPIPELKLGEGPRPLAALALAARTLRAVAALRRATRDADVIVANSVLCLPALKLARPSAPVVWLVHDVITRRDLEQMARLTSGVVARSVPVSEAAGELSRRLGIPTTVVYNGVEVGPEVGVEPADPPVVGLNAVLTHWKGQHVLLDAAGLLGGPTIVELLGGTMPKDGAYERRLRDRCEQPDLAGRVRLLGHRDRPAEVMRRWSVAVSASVEPEAGPLSVLEAMALGIPLVVSDHGGARELVGECGVVVPVGDPVALARAIDELIGDPENARRLGRAGRERVVAHFDRAVVEQEFIALLHEVAASSDRGVAT